MPINTQAQWLTNSQYQRVVTAESYWINKFSQCHKFEHVALLGSSHQEAILANCAAQSRYLFSNQIGFHPDHPACYAELNELPISEPLFDFCILAHGYEHYENPKQVIAQACNTVLGDGYLAILGFHPFGAWGIKSKMARSTHRHYLPSTVKRWLRQNSMQIITTQNFLFSLPSAKVNDYQPQAPLEKYASTLLPYCAGAYLILAQKKLFSVTPLRARFKTSATPKTIKAAPTTSFKEH